MILSALLVIAGLIGVNCAKFPSNLPQCSKLNAECMRGAAETIILAAANPKGLPALGIPSLAPLIVKTITIKQGADSPVNIELNFRNAALTGFDTAVVKKVSGFDKINGTKELRFSSDHLALNGDYTANGKVLILPVQGDGKCNLTLAEPEANIKFTVKKVQRNGETYIQTDKFKFTFTTTRLYIHMSNLYKGDKALGDNTNLFLNENWQDILNELKPNVAKAFGQVFESIINAVFNKFPYNALFSD